MLPVNPVGQGNSPYSGVSACAGNPLLISLQDLAEEGLLEPAEIALQLAAGRCDYPAALTARTTALRAAHARFSKQPKRYRAELESFREEAVTWLGDYALFMALRQAQAGRRWTEWPRDLARHEPRALERAARELEADVAYFEFEQFVFARQWKKLRAYCRERGIGLIGDAPIFIAHESADVWANARYFMLDRSGEPTHVAGVPPDYFSKTGQRWGNPLYRWDLLKRDGYGWWIERFRNLLRQFDVVRLDHFIGFSRFWQIPASEATAVKGRWVPGPGRALFEAAREALGEIPFIAEDLGEVTPEVRQLRDELGLPGMRVLQFAFGTDVQASDFLPHRYIRNAVAYTGTHDNDTFLGWFDDHGGRGTPRTARQAAQERRLAVQYFAGPSAKELHGPAHWEAIRVIYGSVADTAIIPMQDVLGLTSDARMNSPGRASGSWEWRLRGRELGPGVARQLRAYAETYGRAVRPERSE